ncbi:hypothetical protein T492DRAFT_591866, partial [Pavlovales sp. CCMP2436]
GWGRGGERGEGVVCAWYIITILGLCGWCLCRLGRSRAHTTLGEGRRGGRGLYGSCVRGT